MANQRKKGKKNINAWIDESLKSAITETGFNPTEFIELSILRALLDRKKITTKRILSMEADGLIHRNTARQLRAEGLLPHTGCNGE